MKPRTLFAPVGVAAVLAGALIPTATASASTPSSTQPAFSSTAPTFVTIDGHSTFDGLFDVHNAPADIVLRGGDQPGGIATVTDVDTGDTVCEAPNTAPAGEDAAFRCTASAVFRYGETHLKAVVRSRDGQLVSQPSKQAGVVRQYKGSVIVVDSYDDVTKTARVSGTSMPGERFDVSIGYSGNRKDSGTVKPDGSWSATVAGYERESRLVITLPDLDWSVAASVVLHKQGYAPEPSVCGCTIIGSTAKVTFVGEPGIVNVYDRNDRRVAAAVIAPGKRQAIVHLPVPRGEHPYTAELVQGDAVSKRISFTLREGEPSEAVAAPSVSHAAIHGNSVTTAVSADAGGVVTVTDESGRVVAVGVVGASGTRQIRFAMPTNRAALPTYTVFQSVDGSTSQPTQFTPVAG